MFETLMKYGGYRVDYVNEDAHGVADAFAFYVRGEMPEDLPYSTTAKHHLLAGLQMIQKEFGNDKLYAVYLDVNSAHNLYRPAYVQLKRDLRAGAFRRVFTVVSHDLLGDRVVLKDLWDLYQEVDGFEVLSCDNGVCEPDPLFREWIERKGGNVQ